MTTTRHEITAADGWVKVADTDDASFFLENQGGSPIHVHFGTSPSAGAPYHVLPPPKSYMEPSALVRVAVGDVYIKTPGAAVAIVS
tara:strand:+ start:28189 stop:28446 length:258 start_codon:yes stop_codon:yes gene_type:complete